MTHEQATLIDAIALADAEPTARNRELVRLAVRQHFNATIDRLKIERGIRPPRTR